MLMSEYELNKETGCLVLVAFNEEGQDVKASTKNIEQMRSRPWAGTISRDLDLAIRNVMAHRLLHGTDEGVFEALAHDWLTTRKALDIVNEWDLYLDPCVAKFVKRVYKDQKGKPVDESFGRDAHTAHWRVSP